MYELALPKGLRLYLVFYVSLLELAPDLVLVREELDLELEYDEYDVERV